MKLRTIFWLIVLLVLTSAVVFRDQLGTQVVALLKSCTKPIPYSIGTIDGQFKLSPDALKKTTLAAEHIWEDAYYANLFQYSEQAPLKINVTFDERQQLTQQSKQISKGIEVSEAAYNSLKAKYLSLLSDYKTRLTKYNDEVQSWNVRGGAPPAEYERLREEAGQLNSMVDQLNTLVTQLNSLGQKLNINVDEFNNVTNEFNQTLIAKPEAGLYSPLESKITIYQFANQKELQVTIAHEFGHVLGLNHIQTADALMNPQITEKTHLTSEDIAALKEVCSKPKPATFAFKIYQIFGPIFHWLSRQTQPAN